MSNVDVPPENDSDENEIESPVDGPTPDWMNMATASSSTPSLTEENTPDWLKGIQSGKSFDDVPTTEETSDEADSGMSDLERLLAEEGVDLNAVEEERPEGAAGMSARDWMIATSEDEMIRKRVGQELQSEMAQSPKAAATDDDSGDSFAGMSDIERLLAEEGVDLNVVEEERPEGAGDMSARDWMISTSEDEMIRNRVGEEEMADEALPDWLEEEEEPAPVAEPPVSAGLDDGMIDEEGLPDWLQEVADDETVFSEPEAEIEAETAAETGDSDLPDWLRDVEAEPVFAGHGDSAPADDDKMVIDEGLPDWLRDEDEAESGVTEPAALAAAPAGDDKMVIEDDLPDWLRDVEEEVAAVPHAEAITEPEDVLDAAQELPDWLRDVEQEAATQTQPQPVVASADVETEDKMVIEEALPDWLQEDGAETDLVGEPAFSTEDHTIVDEEGLPDWLRDVEDAGDTGEEPELDLVAGAIHVDADDENLPDWLRAVQDDSDEAAEPEPMPMLADVADITPEDEFIEVDELPDWLQEVQEAPEEQSEALFAASTESEDEIIVEDELPDWLNEVVVGEDEVVESFEPDLQEIEDVEITDETLPDWLQDVEEETVETVVAAAGSGVDADISEEDLPDWLQDVDVDIDGELEAEPIAEEIEPEPVVAEIKPEAEPEIVPEPPAAEIIETAEEIVEPEPVPAPPASQPAPGGMPDWLRKLREDDVEPVVTSAQPAPLPVPEPQPVVIRAQTAVQPEPDDSADEISFEDLPEDSDERLKLARSTRDSGDIDQAARMYESLVASSAHLDTVIDDIELTLRTYPSNFKLYQVMGDAMMKDGRLQGALESYRKALEKLAG